MDKVVIRKLEKNIHPLTALGIWAREARNQGISRSEIDEFKRQALELEYKELIKFIESNSYVIDG